MTLVDKSLFIFLVKSVHCFDCLNIIQINIKLLKYIIINIIKNSKIELETLKIKMSEIVDQIDKLKGKAHALKESVSAYINMII